MFHIDLDEHEQQTDAQQRTADPDALQPQPGSHGSAYAGAQAEEEEHQAVVFQPHQLFRIMGVLIMHQGFHCPSGVGDAHGGIEHLASELAETLDLHGAAEGNDGVGNDVFRDKRHNRQQNDFTEQNPLPPVNLFKLLQMIPGLCSGIDTGAEKQHRNQVMEKLSKITVKEAAGQKHQVACLGIGKHLAPDKIGIGILKAAGQRQKSNGPERF